MSFKTPKTKSGRRSLPLPPIAVDAIQQHRRQQIEIRKALEQGELEEDGLVFCGVEGEPLPPNNLSRDWARVLRQKGLPAVSFHSLRHSFASLLIAAGIDILTVSRRLGHSRPSTTLNVYGHLVHDSDEDIVAAIETGLRRGK